MRQGQRLGQNADVGGAFDENVVVGQERVILRDARLEVVQEFRAVVDPAVGQIVVNAADGDVAVGQAGAANFLE